MYGEWAALEAAGGSGSGATRAAAILSKGRAAGAEPAAVLDLAGCLVAGRPVPPSLEAAVPRWHEAPLGSEDFDETTTVRLQAGAGATTTHTAHAAAAATTGRVSTTTTGTAAVLTSTTAASLGAPAAVATPGGSAARWGATAAAATTGPPAPTPTAGLRAPGGAAAPTPGGGGTTRILPPSTFKVPRRIGAAAGTPLPAAAGRAGAGAAVAATPPPPTAAAVAAAAKRKAAGEAGVSPAPVADTAAARAPAPAPPPVAAAAAPKRRSPDPGAAAAARHPPTRPPLAALQGGCAAPPAPSSSSSPAGHTGPARAAPPPAPGGRSPAVAAPAAPGSGGAARPTTTTTTRRPREDEASIVVRGTRYAKLECVGRGGSSKVFKVMSPSRKIYALKRIRLAGRDAEAAGGFIDEIGLLTRLRGQPGIVQLVDAEVVPGEGLILMVLEYGDIDLARLLARQARAQQQQQQQQAGGGGSAGGGGGHGAGAPATPSNATTTPPPFEPDENFIRLYWQQMLRAVAAIHAARIVHSDLKPANFLVVQGALKLIDFGIAKAISPDTTSISRESQVGTLNYMSPEAILGGAPTGGGAAAGAKVGRPSDVWSLGCILYQMVHGRTPFAHLPFIQKMHAITDDRHAIAWPAVRGPAGGNGALQDVLRRCLDRNPRTRITIPELQAHPFLRPTAERELGGSGGSGGGGDAPAGIAPPSGGVVGLTREQLQALLAKAAAAGAAGGLDVEGLLAETGLGGGGGSAPRPVAAAAAPKPPAAAAAAAAAPPSATTSTGGVAASLAALRFDDTAGSGPGAA